jgi:hypothetical protein
MGKTNDTLLQDAFPEVFTQIEALRIKNAALDELCQDFVTLMRQFSELAQDPAKFQASYVADLSEGIEEIRQDILRQLEASLPTSEHPGTAQHTGKETK